MDDQRPTSPPAARDVAGAWLICLLFAVLGLGLMTNLHDGMPPAATAAAAASPCPSASGSACQLSADATAKTAGAIAGLYRLTPSTSPVDIAAAQPASTRLIGRACSKCRPACRVLPVRDPLAQIDPRLDTDRKAASAYREFD